MPKHTEKSIMDYLNTNNGSTSEYELLKHLEKNCPEFLKDVPKSPTLCQKHFLLFNRLYNLKEQLVEEGLVLMISAIEIRIDEYCTKSTEIGEYDYLSEFYLDIDNLKLSQEDIDKMLAKFWVKYSSLDQKQEKLKVLGLESEPDLDQAQLKERFSQLAFVHHPDRGGKAEDFHAIKKAYETLKNIVAK